MKAMFFIAKRVACLNTQYTLHIYKCLDIDLTLLKTRNCVLKSACKQFMGLLKFSQALI